MKNGKLKFVFIKGSPFGDLILEKLIRANYKPALITDNPNKEQISKINPDLIIAAGFNRPLSKEILEIPQYGSLKVHASLLPRWRGASPIQYAILNRDKKTGATIILMEERLDHGPILNQRTLTIEKTDNSKNLHEKLSSLGASLLMETIPKWTRKMIRPKPQDKDKATYSKELTKQEGEINWKKDAEELERQIRAFNFWPGSYTLWRRKSSWGKKTPTLFKIHILQARTFKRNNISYSVGKTLVVPQNEIAIQCGKGFLGREGDFLVIEKLQLEDEKPMSPEEFLRKYPDFIGTVLK